MTLSDEMTRGEGGGGGGGGKGGGGGGGGDEWLFSDKMTGEGGAAKDQSDCVENNVACPSQMIYISQPYIRLSFFVIRTFQGISQRPGTKHKKAIFM